MSITYSDVELSSALDEIFTNDVFTESLVTDISDIYYNKIPYENGDINLLFIIGYSGGGKSTMSKGEMKFGREVVDMDKIVLGTAKGDEYFKNMGRFSYSFITGPGKRYRVTGENVEALRNNSDTYRKDISLDLIKYAKEYASSHHSLKLVMEGVWIYRYIEPSSLDKYAIYIKGTSLKTSVSRAIKRDNALLDKKHASAGEKALKSVGKVIFSIKDGILGHLEKYQKYYEPLAKAQEKTDKIKISKKIINGITRTKKDIDEGITSARKKIMYGESENMEDINEMGEIITETSTEKKILDRDAKVGELEKKIDDAKSSSEKEELEKDKAKADKEINGDKKDAEEVKESKKSDDELEDEDEKDSKKKDDEEEKDDSDDKESKDDESDEDDDDKEDDSDDDSDNDDSEDDDEKDKKDKKKSKKLDDSDEDDDEGDSKEDDDDEDDLDFEEESVSIRKYEGIISRNNERLSEIYETTNYDIIHKSEINALNEEIENAEKYLFYTRMQETANMVKDRFFEAAKMEDEIKPIVDKLNAKGYKVKYASPGHIKLRKKEDSDRNGVYYGKLYSDARIMFDSKYDFNAPKYWMHKDVDGCSYLDIVPITYNKDDGSTDEAFAKWKDNYMDSLREFVDKLGGDKKEDSNTKEDDNKDKETDKVEESTDDDLNKIMSSTEYMDNILDELLKNNVHN